MTRARDELVLSHAADYGGQRRAARVAVRARGAGPARGAAARRGRREAGVAARAARGARAAPKPRPPAARRSRRRAAAAVVLRDRRLPDLPAASTSTATSCGCRSRPHHSMIYGSALHAAVAEFHRRHARGDVMTEDAAVRRRSRPPGRTTGSCRASTRRRASTAGREALRRFREEQLPAGRGRSRRTWSESSASCSTATGCAAGSTGWTSCRATATSRSRSWPDDDDPASACGRRGADARPVPGAGRRSRTTSRPTCATRRRRASARRTRSSSRSTRWATRR